MPLLSTLFTSFRQVLKKMHTKENCFPFYCLTVYLAGDLRGSVMAADAGLDGPAISFMSATALWHATSFYENFFMACTHGMIQKQRFVDFINQLSIQHKASLLKITIPHATTVLLVRPAHWCHTKNSIKLVPQLHFSYQEYFNRYLCNFFGNP